MSSDQTPEKLAILDKSLQSSEFKPEMQINNKGEAYVNNRATRRRKPIVDRDFTKSTRKDKKLRSKNVKRNNNRKRAAARARKTSQENNSQIS